MAPKQTIPARGMANIRTMAGKAGQPQDACLGYMRISFLELERARRRQELRNAEQTIRRITARFREIDAEKLAILDACGGGTIPREPRRAHAPRGTIAIRY